jgi:hypothetical protein
VSMRHIVLRLAPSPGTPHGDLGTGYRLVAPLDAAGRLDPACWRKSRQQCTVIRFGPDSANDEPGLLGHREASWFLDCPGAGCDSLRLEDRQFALGSYVSVRDGAGVALSYRVTQNLPVSDVAFINPGRGESS